MENIKSVDFTPEQIHKIKMFMELAAGGIKGYELLRLYGQPSAGDQDIADIIIKLNKLIERRT